MSRAKVLTFPGQPESKAQTKATATAFPLASVLTVVFAAAKVFGFSQMSWLWVLSPIWITFGLVLAVLTIALLALGGIALFEHHQKTK